MTVIVVTAVVFSATSVDVYNPKTVRASAGSLFHLPVSLAPEDRKAQGLVLGDAVGQLVADNRKQPRLVSPGTKRIWQDNQRMQHANRCRHTRLL